MAGGVFGLDPIGTGQRWGGLPLTVILTLIGSRRRRSASCWLARRSSLALLRSLAVAYIELLRGVPLITVLFVATFLFPLVLPAGSAHRSVLARRDRPRAVPGRVHGRTVRGGLQSVSRAQHEAATSLGLRNWQAQRAVILPQALVAVTRPSSTTCCRPSCDTSLVTSRVVYDLTGSLRSRSATRNGATSSSKATSSSRRSISPAASRFTLESCG